VEQLSRRAGEGVRDWEHAGSPERRNDEAGIPSDGARGRAARRWAEGTSLRSTRSSSTVALRWPLTAQPAGRASIKLSVGQVCGILRTEAECRHEFWGDRRRGTVH